MRSAMLLGGVLALAGCTVGPAYDPPELGLPEHYRFDEAGATEALNTPWWTGFGDPVLEELLAESISNNIDLRLAAARVDEFMARIGLTRSAAFPQVDYDAGAGRTQQSREIGAGAAGGPRVVEFFEANLNVGWELDLFGRIRRATDAALAEALAEEENRRAVLLSLVSSVATTYIALRSLDEQLTIADQRLQTRRDTLRLFTLQYENGVISRLELAQIRSELERTAATIPAIEREIGLLENALSVLLGRPPGPIPRGRALTKFAFPAIPAGLPSELLRQRPDLIAAEQRLIAANERVGVAVAAFYPRLALTASAGLASDDLSNFATGSAATYSLAAGLVGPLFTAGFLENQLNIAEAGERQALERYRSAVLVALREVEDALVSRSTTEAEGQAQSRQVDALADYAALAQQRYDNGYVGYLEVLDAERALFDADLQRVQIRASLLASYVAAYKAFGGGWITRAEALSGDADPRTEQPASGDLMDHDASGDN